MTAVCVAGPMSEVAHILGILSEQSADITSFKKKKKLLTKFLCVCVLYCFLLLLLLLFFLGGHYSADLQYLRQNMIVIRQSAQDVHPKEQKRLLLTADGT